MDRKAFYKLEYGVFLVSTRSGDKVNACITNTCIQAAANPVQVAVCCINANYTTELIKESGLFTVSVLDQSVTFDTIKHYGMQSGRDVDKLAGQDMGWDANGLPYLKEQANAVLRCRVVTSSDLGSHTLFVGEVLDAWVLGSTPSLTYAKYQSDVKPKAPPKEEPKPIVGWKCKICGYVYEDPMLPETMMCPLCGHGAEDFEPIYGEAKPKAAEKVIVAWKCKICGYVYEGAELPQDFSCPLCGHGPEDFEPVYGEAKPEAKPEPKEKTIVAWKCKICGYVYESPTLSEEFLCPLCGHGPEDFEPVYG